MDISAKQIADYLKGEVEGDENTLVNTFSKIEEATSKSICFLANKKYEAYIYNSPAAILLLGKDFKLQQSISNTIIRVDDAYSAFGQLLKMYESLKGRQQKKGIDSLAFIAATAKVDESAFVGAFSYISENVIIGKNVYIYPNVFIGENVTIADNSIIYPLVSIYKECFIGKNVIIHSGTIIGSDGFGFAPQKDGSYDKIPQIGNVIIEDHVEIGANTVIDRSTMGSTIIHSGVKLDNLIQIAHNVEVGKDTVIAAQTGISGSTKIGSNCVIGGQVGIVGHISLANGTKINAQSGVAKSITQEGTAISGSPAFDYKSEVKSQIIFRKLPDLIQRLNQLEAEINNLKEKKS
ncbi:MAG TPA: UDP-3-O-(3-hydroxymyristoyl)glucosamine N-acyltransferase [Edaphocola sp.]|nr:UDP-3-O-(3-hydroxymyristoyl)glucosamine N-acyltransferase [Edaphocola sp.]